GEALRGVTEFRLAIVVQGLGHVAGLEARLTFGFQPDCRCQELLRLVVADLLLTEEGPERLGRDHGVRLHGGLRVRILAVLLCWLRCWTEEALGFLDERVEALG